MRVETALLYYIPRPLWFPRQRLVHYSRDLMSRGLMPRTVDTADGVGVHSPARPYHLGGGSAKWFLTVLAATLLAFILGCEAPSVDSRPGQTPAEQRPGAASSVQADRHSNPASAPAATHTGRIVAFGDSLTAGLGVPPEDTYPAHLQRWLNQAGYPFRVVNAGVSGETSAGGLRRVDWVLKSNPNLVILELGANDGLRGVDPAQTRANLEAIIRKFRTARVPVVLVGMKLPPNYGARFTKDFADIYPDLARKYGLPFMPFFLEDVALNDHLTQADGIHPTGRGYEVIVRNLTPILQPVLADLIPEQAGAAPRG